MRNPTGAPCFICGLPTWTRRADARPDTKHRACFEHGQVYAYAKHGCRCEECRAANAASMREYAARRRQAGRPLSPKRSRVDVECVQCGQAFECRSGERTRFCSMACVGASRQVHDGETVKARRARLARHRAARRRLDAAAAGTTGGSRVWVMGPCSMCGLSFLSPGAASTYCSRECRNEFRRMGAAWIGRTTRLEIYKAAAWCCQICGDEMSRRYDPADPWSPTLDHIVPRSRGGTDDPGNLRASHAWCNSVRSDARIPDSEFRASV